MAALADYLAIARPRHWIKNLFVFMPLPHALAAGGVLDAPAFVAGVAGFSLTCSAVYAFNDCKDAAADRLHPRKRDRPVAAGRLKASAGVAFGLVLAALGLLLVWSSGSASAVRITVLYMSINLLYAFWGRSVPLLDVFLLASGFVLRVLLGCALVQVTASGWLLLCTSTLALFMALIKRRSDVQYGVTDGHRKSLGGYDLRFLEQATSITAAMTLMSYAIYCMESEVLHAGREFASLPFAVFGVLEYLRRGQQASEGGSPVDLSLRSRVLQLCGLGWLIATLWSLEVW